MFPIVLPAFCRCVGLAQRGSPTPQFTSEARSVDQMIEGYEKVPWSAERCVLPVRQWVSDQARVDQPGSSVLSAICASSRARGASMQ